jgi:propionyl-CoA carboxylase alpha chain
VECATAAGDDGEDGAPVAAGLVSTASGLEVIKAEPTKVVLSWKGITRAYGVDSVHDEFYVDGPDGSTTLTRVERFTLPGSQLLPGSLVAPLPGTVVRVGVSAGDTVAAGDALIAIEAMKMEHEVRAGKDGTVAEVAVVVGDQVESGRLLVVVKENDDSSTDS